MDTNAQPLAKTSQSENRLNNRLQNTGRTRFKKGTSGNPGGRPQGLAFFIRENTKDGKELAEIMLQIARDPNHRERVKTIEWLADRGFGRSVTTLEISGKDGGPIQVEHASAEDIMRELQALGALDARGRLIQQN